MTKLLRWLLVCTVSSAALVAVAARAQAPSVMPPPAARADDAAGKRGFFWEARKGDKRVYLLGTIHVGRAAFYPPHADYSRRLNEAAVIAVEANVFEAQKVLPVLQRLAFYPEGDAGLGSHVSPALKERVAAAIKRAGLDERAWRMKPWMLATTLVVMEAGRLGYSSAYATEAFLFTYAQSMQKPIVEIETIELQLSLFDSAPADVQTAYLEQAVRSLESGEAEREVKNIVAAWERRDTAAAERLLAEIRSGTGPAERFVVEQLFDGRHARMVEAIERYAASGKLHVVAVGSLHYFGPTGLLAQLRERGYTVTAVP
jgi:hypothetical protein